MSEWWLSRGDGKTEGPLSVQALVNGLVSGQIPNQSQVCRVGEQSWTRISQIDEIWEAANPEQVRTNITERPWFLNAPEPNPHPKAVDFETEDERTQLLTPLPVVTPGAASKLPFVTPLPRQATHRELFARQHASTLHTGATREGSASAPGDPGAAEAPMRAKVPTLAGISGTPQLPGPPTPKAPSRTRMQSDVTSATRMTPAGAQETIRTPPREPAPPERATTTGGSINPTTQTIGIAPLAGLPPQAAYSGVKSAGKGIAGIASLESAVALTEAARHPKTARAPEHLSDVEPHPVVPRTNSGHEPAVPSIPSFQKAGPKPVEKSAKALSLPGPALPPAHRPQPLPAPTSVPTRRATDPDGHSIATQGDATKTKANPGARAPNYLGTKLVAPEERSSDADELTTIARTAPKPVSDGSMEDDGENVLASNRPRLPNTTKTDGGRLGAEASLQTRVSRSSPGMNASADDDELTAILSPARHGHAFSPDTLSTETACDEDATTIIQAHVTTASPTAKGGARPPKPSYSAVEVNAAPSVSGGDPNASDSLLTDPDQLLEEFGDDDSAEQRHLGAAADVAVRFANPKPLPSGPNPTRTDAAKPAFVPPSTPPPARRPRFLSAPSIVLNPEPLVHQEATQPAARALRNGTSPKSRLGTTIVVFLALALAALAIAYSYLNRR